MVSLAKKRKMNFSEREVEIIVEEIEKQRHVLVNHFNAGVTHVAKNNAWIDILKKVNTVTTCPRELAEVKKKWSDMKTEVRRKVVQAREAVEDTGECTSVPVILTSMQQRVCNLLGEATIITLPGVENGTEMIPVTASVTLTEADGETAYHAVDGGGVVEYCTATVAAVATETPVELLLPAVTESPTKPQELKSRIALNSAWLLQEHRVTNMHVREIAQHLQGQNELLQTMRRSQEAQAHAQERQAKALEGTQAALHALVQMMQPALRDLRKFLQNSAGAGPETQSQDTEPSEKTTQAEDG